MSVSSGVLVFRCLTIEERAATQFTHRLDFSVANIPAAIAVNTAYVFDTPAEGMPILKAGMIVKRSQMYLSVPLKDASDAAFNSTTISVGDASSATKFFSAIQANENGTEVLTSFPGTENTIYTADSQMSFTVNSMAAKSISDLDIGAIYVLFNIDNAADPAKKIAPPFTGGGYT